MIYANVIDFNFTFHLKKSLIYVLGSVYTNIVGSMPSFLGKLFHTFGPYLLKTPFQGSN